MLALGCSSDADLFQNYISKTEKPQIETQQHDKEAEADLNPEPEISQSKNTEKLGSNKAESNSNNLILKETFDEASILPVNLGGFYQEFATDHAFAIDEIIKRKGRSSGRFEIRKNDPLIWGGTRSEISQPHNMAVKECWYGFSQYFPESFISDTSEEVVGQWHVVPDVGETAPRSPSNALVTGNDRIKWTVRWDKDRIMDSGIPDGLVDIDLGKIPKNRWIDWVIHIKFAHDSSGILEVWMDGEKVIDRQNMPNCYNDKEYPYLKIGVYKWSWGNASKRVVYYDEIRVGNENCSYNDVSTTPK